MENITLPSWTMTSETMPRRTMSRSSSGPRIWRSRSSTASLVTSTMRLGPHAALQAAAHAGEGGGFLLRRIARPTKDRGNGNGQGRLHRVGRDGRTDVPPPCQARPLRDLGGASELSIDLPDKATVGDLL